jgi:diguanylate cyclase (GGDEF)-like protein
MRFSGLRGTALNPYFLGAVAIILLCSAGLGTNVLSGYYRTFHNSELGLGRLIAFRAVLDAANRVSVERRPTNAALGRITVGDGARAGGFALARQATDAALAGLASSPAFSASVADLQDQLRRTRADVDALLDRPQPERAPAAVERAIQGMFATYDLTQPLLDTAMTALLKDDSNLVGRAMTARMIGELRDYAGRLGSYIVIVIAQGRPMTPEQRAAFEATRGRVWQLWENIQQQIVTSGTEQVVRASQDTAHAFIRDGLLLIDSTRAQLDAGQADLTTASFTRMIVPSFKPIEELREAYLAMTIRELETRRDVAEEALVYASAATGLALTVELLLLLAGQHLFFRPLLLARQEVIRLAEGRLEPAVAGPGLRGEMRGLFDALVTLRAKLIERDRLDEERTRLEQQLRRQADTDGLTDVLNRGALERLVPQLASAAAPVALILLDLDHFKGVNDRYGHAAGDAVLRSTAQRLRGALREEDVLARFGGEEFAIIVTGQSPETIASVAERLRQIVASEPFVLPDGGLIALTASLGTAMTAARPAIWLDLLRAADMALYAAKQRGRNRVIASGDDA